MSLFSHVQFLLKHLDSSFIYSKGRVRKTPAGGGEFKKQSVKYTAQKLHEKGVILEIEGLPSHQYVVTFLFFYYYYYFFNNHINRFKNAVFEITSKDVGTFEVTGKFFGVSMEKVELVFQVCLWYIIITLWLGVYIILPY